MVQERGCSQDSSKENRPPPEAVQPEPARVLQEARASNSEEMLQALQEVADGAEIQLEHGCELRGPFLLDHPVRIVGHGRSTCLYSTKSPVVVIRSPGVRLENLGIVGLGANQPAVILLGEVKPVLQQVEISKGRVITVASDRVVDLGDLVAGISVNVPLEIESDEPMTIRALSSGLAVEPSSVTGPGRHGVQLRVAGSNLVAREMLISELELNAPSGRQSLWLIGRVIDKTAPSLLQGEISLLSGEGRRYLPCPGGMLLGKAALSELSGAEQLEELQAELLRDAGGYWAMVQIGVPNPPNQVNGHLLLRGQRRLLRVGDNLAVGPITLKVEGQSVAALQLDSALVDFGSVRDRTAATRTLQLTYTERGTWKGKLRATVPWIEVLTPEVQCANGATVQLEVRPSAAISGLAPGERHAPAALLLSGKNETLWIDAKIDVQAATILLEANPTTVDFGEVDSAQAVTEQAVVVRNRGTRDWQGSGRLSPSATWLSLKPVHAHCPAGREVTFKLSVNDTLNSLPLGEKLLPGAVEFEGEGITLQIGVRIKVKESVPILETKPQLIDFGPIEQAATAPSRTLLVRNLGKKDWTGTVRTAVPWLKPASPNAFCPVGGQVPLSFSASTQLQPGEYKEVVAVTFGGALVPTPTSAHILITEPAPVVEFGPALLDFGEVLYPEAAVRSVTVRNRGRRDWKGTLRPIVAWLTLPSSDCLCPAGAEESIEVRTTDRIVDLPPGECLLPTALTFDGMGVKGEIGARVVVPAPVPRVVLDTALLDFGEVEDPAAAPVQLIRLRNEGKREFSGAVRSAPWLTLSASTLRCAAGGEASLLVRLNSQMETLSAGSLREAEALILEGEGIRLTVEAQLRIREKPVPEVEPLIIDFGNVQDWQSAPSAYLRVRRRGGRGDWRTEVHTTPPWLEPDSRLVACAPDADALIGLKLTRDLAQLGPGNYDLPQGIVLEADGLRLTVPIRIRIEAPKTAVEVEPIYLHFGKVFPEDWDAQQPKTVTVRSLGKGWTGTAQGPDWVVVEPGMIRCGTNGKEMLKVSLRPGAGSRLSLGSTEGILAIVGAEERHEVKLLVAVARRALKPLVGNELLRGASTPGAEELIVPAIVDFGAVPDWKSAGTQKFQLVNSATSWCRGNIRSRIGWLLVSPEQFECPPSSSATIEVRLKSVILHPHGNHTEPQALLIQAEGHEYQLDVHLVEGAQEAAAIRLSAPPPPPSASVKPHPLGNRAPARGTSRPAASEAAKTPLQPQSAGASGSISVTALLDFGSIGNWNYAPPLVLEIRNDSNEPWSGTAQARVNWLEVESTAIACAPQGATTVSVRLKRIPLLQRPRGANDVPGAILVAGQGKEWRVRVKIIA